MATTKCFNCGEYPRYEFLDRDATSIPLDENGKPCPHGIIHSNTTCLFKRDIWHYTKKEAEAMWNKHNNRKDQIESLR